MWSHSSRSTAASLVSKSTVNMCKMTNASSHFKNSRVFFRCRLWMGHTMAFETIGTVLCDAKWWNPYGWLIHISSVCSCRLCSLAAQREHEKIIINKRDMCVCAWRSASRPMNVQEHVVSCCGDASFHYMVQSHVYFSISVNLANTHKHRGSHVYDAAVAAATGPHYCCCSETQTSVAFAHSFVCVLWNVKSNLPIARLRAENETTTCTVRLRAKETIARVGNDDCDCAMSFQCMGECVCVFLMKKLCMLFVRYCTEWALRQCDSSISIQFENGRQC